MSITNAKRFWKGESAKLDWQQGLGPKSTHEEVWVCNSSLNDASQVVLAFNAASGTPSLGSPLPENALSILKSMAADRADGTLDAWYVRLSYSPADDEREERPDENGNMTAVPSDWRDEIDTGTMQITVPVEKAIYRGGFVGVAGALKAVGELMIPMNSAFVPFDPGLEKEVGITTYRVTKFRDSYSGATMAARRNKVNSDNVVFNKPAYKLTDTWAPRTARIVSAGGQFQVNGDQAYWRHVYEVHINPDGWREDVVDRGLSARAMPGDPDGQGGTISMATFKNGQPAARALLDWDLVPLTEPILLNGDGQPLGAGLPPVYITYQKYDEVPFAPFNL